MPLCGKLGEQRLQLRILYPICSLLEALLTVFKRFDQIINYRCNFFFIHHIF